MKELLIHRHRYEPDDDAPGGAVIRVDDGGFITFADINSEQLFGYDHTELRGQPFKQLVATRQDNPLLPPHDETLRSGETVMLTLRHRDGVFFTGHIQLRVDMMDADQAADAHIEQRPDLPLDNRVLNVVEEAGKLGVWEFDVRSNRLSWSDGVYRLFELRVGQEISPDHALYYFHDQQQRIRAAFRRCLRNGKPFRLDLDILTARQQKRWVRLSGKPLARGEHITSLAGTLVDVSDEYHRTAEKLHWRGLFRSLMAATEDLVVAVDRDLRILALNKAYADQFESTFGKRPEEGVLISELLEDSPNERRLYQRLWERALERDSFCVEMPLAQQERELPVYEIHYHRLRDSDGEIIGATHMARNISSRLRVSDNLNYLSSHDPMTGLLNRREFLVRLRRALELGVSRGTPCSLLYLDLDNYAEFNNEAGPGSGDRYLRELAGLLAAKVRQRDALARVGSDKFAVLLDNCSEAEARKVSENLRQVIESFAFEWREHVLQTTVSGGLIPIEESEQGSAEDLLALAADLCQTARNAGRSRIHVHRDQSIAMEEHAARELLEHLQQCIHRDDGLILEYLAMRPVSSVTWGDYVEILVRLPDNTAGADHWHPESFLPIAERFDLACQLDRQVIYRTLQWLNRQELLEPRLKLCSFNLSMASVMDTDLPDYIADLVESSRFPADVFCFEIRERDATQEPENVARCCEALKKIGCKLALDGVGASVQSYSLIAKLPVDIIKFDQSLMRTIEEDPVQQVIIEALHKIAEVSGKITVAPFIESDQALREVRRLGIHFAQGFRLLPPRALSDLAPVDLASRGGSR